MAFKDLGEGILEIFAEASYLSREVEETFLIMERRAAFVREVENARKRRAYLRNKRNPEKQRQAVEYRRQQHERRKADPVRLARMRQVIREAKARRKAERRQRAGEKD